MDLGIPPIVARDRNLVGRLKDLNCLQVAGNRFARGLSDIPAGMKEGEGSDPEALIDVLVPAYTSRPRDNVQVGEDLARAEVDLLAREITVRCPARYNRLEFAGQTATRSAFVSSPLAAYQPRKSTGQVSTTVSPEITCTRS